MRQREEAQKGWHLEQRWEQQRTTAGHIEGFLEGMRDGSIEGSCEGDRVGSMEGLRVGLVEDG